MFLENKSSKVKCSKIKRTYIFNHGCGCPVLAARTSRYIFVPKGWWWKNVRQEFQGSSFSSPCHLIFHFQPHLAYYVQKWNSKEKSHLFVMFTIRRYETDWTMPWLITIHKAVGLSPHLPKVGMFVFFLSQETWGWYHSLGWEGRQEDKLKHWVIAKQMGLEVGLLYRLCV